MRILWIIGWLICCSFLGLAQTQPPSTSVNSVIFGNKVPNIQFNVLNASTLTIDLADLKGKLVILDFWATWCTSCVRALDKMEQLQKEFAPYIQIVLVNSIEGTGDKKEDIEAFIAERKSSGFSTELPFAYEDRVTKSMFPRTFLPHYVWIDSSGRYFATTSSAWVDSTIIKTLLKDRIR